MDSSEQQYGCTSMPNSNPDTQQPQKTSTVTDVSGRDVMMVLAKKAGQLVVCVASGAVFGVVIDKSRVVDPSVIVDVLLLERFVMLKTFMSAVASSMFCLSVMSLLPLTQSLFHKATKAYSQCLVGKGVATSLLGGTFIGLGMTLSGSCPGTVFAQIGAQTRDAFYTLAGGFLGVFVYSLVDHTLSETFKSADNVQSYVSDRHYSTIALSLASTIGIAVAALEMAVPWRSELTVLQECSGWMDTLCWPPVLCGIIIGCLQVPLVLAVQDTLGMSSTYCTVLAQLTLIKTLAIKLRYLTKFACGVHNWWQVCYMGGMVGGAYLSAYMSQSVASTIGSGAARSFVGGALMLFGARLAGGCTSGHGISGVGLLCKLSLITTPAMFASGIASSLLLNR